MISNSLYIDVAGYRTLDRHTQKALGIDPEGQMQITGVAPYWRLALVRPAGAGTWEVGTFGMAADIYPGRYPRAGKDRLVDVGFDSQFQESFEHGDLTVLVSWIHEHENWRVSQILGATSERTDAMHECKAAVNYLFEKTYGGTVQYVTKNGDHDALLYPDSADGSPRSDGIVLQASYLPFNKGTGPSFLLQSVQWTKE